MEPHPIVPSSLVPCISAPLRRSFHPFVQRIVPLSRLSGVSLMPTPTPDPIACRRPIAPQLSARRRSHLRSRLHSHPDRRPLGLRAAAPFHRSQRAFTSTPTRIPSAHPTRPAPPWLRSSPRAAATRCQCRKSSAQPSPSSKAWIQTRSKLSRAPANRCTSPCWLLLPKTSRWSWATPDTKRQPWAAMVSGAKVIKVPLARP